MAQQYEIEIKSLLGTAENAEKLRSKLKEIEPNTRLISQNKQLNHYFTVGDLNVLKQKIWSLIPDKKKVDFETIIEKGKKYSVRTRDVEGVVLLVIKASLDNLTSENGVSRIEWESSIGTHSLEIVDQMLIDSGFEYQAKWSREREEYKTTNLNIFIDKNAGYGYVAEIEKIILDESKVEETRNEILSFMNSLGVTELPQDRLERMFAYYNGNWRKYYGTENTFTVE